MERLGKHERERLEGVVESLQMENLELNKKLSEKNSINQSGCGNDIQYMSRIKFSLEQELSRRKLHDSIQELFFHLNDQFKQSANSLFSKRATNQILSLLGQSLTFANVGYANERRSKALRETIDDFQAELHRLQHPSDCGSSRILTCELDKSCGFGCQIHHVTYCSIVAYASRRTMVFKNDGRTWSYTSRGWSSIFLPITNCSYDIVTKSGNETSWKINKEARIVHLPVIDSLDLYPSYIPLAFPQSMASKLLIIHSNPPAFFVSMFMKYLMRPVPSVAQLIDRKAARINFEKGPIVGMQVRRTDKIGVEAGFHHLSEYMVWSELWYKIEEYRTGKKFQRRTFIATDDAKVIHEANKIYTEYEIYGDENIAKNAEVKTRNSEESLIGVIIDIVLLSRCDYLVCTFSSQVCRASYELMQGRAHDMGVAFHSLDDLYYFGGQQNHEQIAVESHKAETQEEIDLEVGDVIVIAGNHWNGFSKGKNKRTRRIGLYPSYKVKEKWIIVPFP